MARKRIFIASSTEAKPIASQLAQLLADRGYDPVRWWTISWPGQILIDRLIEIAKGVDGAAFICTSDDKTWYRDHYTRSARQNVLLEYGLFVSKLGRERTVILKDPEVDLPSDVTGIQHQKLTEDNQTNYERAADHFDHVLKYIDLPMSDSLSIVADPEIVSSTFARTPPLEWNVRALFYGLENAKHWLELSSEESYVPSDHIRQVRNTMREAVAKLDVRTYVSLGPGDAKCDEEIAISLRNSEPLIQYIPVDINHGLLLHAARHLAQQVSVPVGILGDFEDRLNFISKQLKLHGASARLFSILGNTLGNLDRYERQFLSTMQSVMDYSDKLMIDVSLRGPQWNEQADMRCSHAGYSPPFRRFIANGIARVAGNEKAEKIIESFEERVIFKVGGSDVPNTKSVNLHDKIRDRGIVSIRRYDWSAFIDWLKDTNLFNIDFERSVYMDDVTGRGIAVLSKRK